jgi:hypothetical protein
MSDGRKRFSGSKYTKRAKDKKYKENKVLNKIPKYFVKLINTMFET